MEAQKKIWKQIEAEQEKYNSLNLNDIIDYNKYYIYSIIAHSTAIEGSTLSEKETQLLFDEGATRKGNIVEYLMNIDLKTAYTQAIKDAEVKTPITPIFLRNLNAMILKNTGSVMNTAVGTFDSAKGEYRLCGVSAGVGGKSYMNFQKVPTKIEQMCDELNKKISTANSLSEIYNLSFDAHFNLATIHPWLDGNGRTARLLMNYIQFYHNVVPTKIFKEDRTDYISSLQKSQEQESLSHFRNFMAKQHLKNLKNEIKNYQQSQNKSNGFKLLF